MLWNLSNKTTTKHYVCGQKRLLGFIVQVSEDASIKLILRSAGFNLFIRNRIYFKKLIG